MFFLVYDLKGTRTSDIVFLEYCKDTYSKIYGDYDGIFISTHEYDEYLYRERTGIKTFYVWSNEYISKNHAAL